MESIHLATSEQKIEWFGYGEWVEEPEQVKFEHLGFKCFVRRIVAFEETGEAFGGHLCAYVNIPIEHPWFEKSSDEIECDCHGGLTYSDFQLCGSQEGYWVGFDCAHAEDICPSMEKVRGKRVKPDFSEFVKNYPDHILKYFNPTYKNINFVIHETKSIAQQAHNQRIAEWNGLV